MGPTLHPEEHDFPVWSATDPDLLATASTRSGSRQVWTYDLRTGAWQQLSDEPIGVDGEAFPLPYGRFAWWRDTSGDERGSLVAATPGGRPEVVFPGLPEGWLLGVAFAGARTVISMEMDGVYTTYVIDPGTSPRVLWSTPFPSGVGRMYPTSGGISADGSFACVCHSEAGDILHNALRVFDVETGSVCGDLLDAGAEPDAGCVVAGRR